MASRGRKERAPAPGAEELQLWHKVRVSLRTLDRHRAATANINATLTTAKEEYLAANAAAAADPAAAPEAEKVKVKVRGIYSDLKNRAMEEQKIIDEALESLSVLTALRQAGDEQRDAKAASRKRRRVTNTGTASPRTSPSLTPAPAASPAPISIPARSSSKVAPEKDLTPALIANLTSKAAPSTAGGSSRSASTSNAKSVDPAKARREVLQGQLPLVRGRKVAFRQPPKSKAGSTAGAPSKPSAAASASTADEEGETWILAVVIECINNDRNRYVVQDAEDTSQPTYNTTLKAIVPLPESLSTLPPEDYKVGQWVMGLYPDTSCFYRARVRGGGPGLSGKPPTAKMKARPHDVLARPYKLEFEDDHGNIQEVPASLVVERP